MNVDSGSECSIRPILIWSVGLLLILLSVVCVYEQKRVKTMFYGVPIRNEVHNLDGTLLHPQGVIVSRQRILIYDEDGKVYALDGIQLDDVTIEELSTIPNLTVRIHRTKGRLVLSKESFWM